MWEVICCARLLSTGAHTSAVVRARCSDSEPFPALQRRCFDVRLDRFGVGWNLLSKQNCSQTGWVGLTPHSGV